MLKEGFQGEKDSFNQEVEILSKVRHPNLVKLLGACKNRALIFEYLPNGSLEDRLRCKKIASPLSLQTRVRIAFKICSALSSLHCSKPHGIVHGDLQLYNILLDGNDTSKLCDFALSRELNDTDSAGIPCHWTDQVVGTAPYIDPEYVSTGKTTTQHDVYYFGYLLLRLVTSKQAHEILELVKAAQNKGALKALIDAVAGPWPFREAEKLISLGLRCRDPMRKHRPDLSTEVLKEIKSMLQVEYSYAELQDATNNFHESFKHRKGGFGIVYKGILRNTTVAIKMLKEGSGQGTKEFNQEKEGGRRAKSAFFEQGLNKLSLTDNQASGTKESSTLFLKLPPPPSPSQSSSLNSPFSQDCPDTSCHSTGESCSQDTTEDNDFGDF